MAKRKRTDDRQTTEEFLLPAVYPPYFLDEEDLRLLRAARHAVETLRDYVLSSFEKKRVLRERRKYGKANPR